MERTQCIGCRQGGTLEALWDLGVQQVVDFPWIAGKPTRPQAPLVLGRCTNCTLVQLLHTVPPSSLFSDAFWYRSSVNERMVRALWHLVEQVTGLVTMQPGDAVLDVGVNDGTLLSLYGDGVRCVGIDPAPVKLIPNARHEHISAFFSAAAVRHAAPFKVITAIAMFYDLEDPHTFLADIAEVLAPDGVFLVQMNTLAGMYEHGAFDNVVHEHLTYYTLRTFTAVLEEHGLVATHVWYNEVNGGSMRVAVRHVHPAGGRRRPSWTPEPITSALAAEARQGVDTRERLVAFREHMHDLCYRVAKAVLESPAPRYLYGASTRGATLFQSLRLPRGTFVGAAERDPLKLGRYYLDTDIPIVHEEAARREAKTFLVLPWHFWDGIVEREFAWCQAGGNLIRSLPIPAVFGPGATRLL